MPTIQLHRAIIDSGASMSFVRYYNAIANPSKRVRSLIKAEAYMKNRSHAGKLQITDGNKPLFVSALVVPSFKDTLLSVGQMVKAHNIIFYIGRLLYTS